MAATGQAKGGDADLAARVSRLEAAVAAAGTSLAAVGASEPSEPTATGKRARAGIPTSAVRKGIRTVLQVGLASIPGFGLARLGHNSVFLWVTTFLLTPVVTYVQNEVEDRLKKGFLRDFGPDEAPPPSPGHDPAP